MLTFQRQVQNVTDRIEEVLTDAPPVARPASSAARILTVLERAVTALGGKKAKPTPKPKAKAVKS